MKYITQQYAIQKSQIIWKQLTYTNNENTWISTDTGKNMRKIESVVLNNGSNKRLKEELVNFANSEQWHLEHGIPYKKTYLFYGPPGTGKTSMIKAMSYEFQRHIHYIALNMIRDDLQLNSLMSQIKLNETIIVIEDVDAMTNVVHDRDLKTTTTTTTTTTINTNTNDNDKNDLNKNKFDNIKHRPGITLSGLLNAIDGIHNNHGMILIMTTNKPEVLDKALLREGRVDDKIYFGTCDNNTIYNLMKNFYNGKMLITEKEFTKLTFPKNITPCKVENFMKKHWNSYENALDSIMNDSETELEKFTY
jgi:SpoVK/Ycf46/Vps4 family AAA+-type ATPase